MKWLEFMIWVYRETGLRAFCLFLTSLWTISWALAEQGPGCSERQESKGEGGRWYVPARDNYSWSAVFI